MRTFLIKFSLFVLVSFTATFISALPPPVNLISPFAIFTALALFLFNAHEALLVALIIGTIEDYYAGSFMGLHASIYGASLGLAMLLRSSVITHETMFSRFLLTVVFSGAYFGITTLALWHLDFTIVKEVIIRILVHTTLSALLLVLISWVQTQIHKRFLAPL